MTSEVLLIRHSDVQAVLYEDPQPYLESRMQRAVKLSFFTWRSFPPHHHRSMSAMLFVDCLVVSGVRVERLSSAPGVAMAENSPDRRQEDMRVLD